MKNVGDKVDDLLGVDADGKEVRLSDFPGKKVALYFYPKDNTAAARLRRAVCATAIRICSTPAIR